MDHGWAKEYLSEDIHVIIVKLRTKEGIEQTY